MFRTSNPGFELYSSHHQRRRSPVGFLTQKLHQSPEKLTILDVSPDLVQAFLLDLEESRHCSIPTRNQRLAAIRSVELENVNRRNDTARNFANRAKILDQSLSGKGGGLLNRVV